MVYGLNEIAISKEAQENIDIGRLYYDIMNEDYGLFGGSNEYLTEAVDFKKLKDTIKEKLKSAVNKVLELIDRLKKRVGEVINKLFNKLQQKSAEILKNKASKISTITIPESANLMKPNTKESPVKAASNKVAKVESDMTNMIYKFKKVVNDYNSWDEEYTAEERLSDAKNSLRINFDSDIEYMAKSIEKLKLNDIFFETSTPGEFTITGSELSKLIGFATDRNLSSYIINSFSRIEKNMKDVIKKLDQNIDNFYEISNSAVKDQEFINNMINLFNSYAYKLTNSCCKSCSTLSVRLGNGCVQYVSTIGRITSLALNSKELKKLTDQDNENKLAAGKI